LHEAGHHVRVVCRQADPILTDRDRRLMQTRKWRLEAIDLCRHGPHRRDWFIESLRSKAYRRLFDAGLRMDSMAIRSYIRGLDRLIALAAAKPADWFIAHTQPALPVAAVAARRWKARLGFDCEDLLAENGTDPPDVVRVIERKYLPVCDYVSVPSQCIAARLAQYYGIDAPIVLNNVFPLYLADGMLCPKQRSAESRLRLHWFGQTIGLGRGIEDAVRAVGLIKQNVELHLRGRITDAYRSTIQSLAAEQGIADKVFFHPPVDHDELVRRMDQFDIGLSLERPTHANYSQTMTNKIFSYLLAGLAVAATDTPGHQELLKQIPSVGFLYPAGNAQALADGLQWWLNNPNELRSAQQAAWDAARQRFCWDHEKEKFLRIFE
jgi:glycosyltransferase involved in cell wall biosynthesis